MHKQDIKSTEVDKYIEGRLGIDRFGEISSAILFSEKLQQQFVAQYRGHGFSYTNIRETLVRIGVPGPRIEQLMRTVTVQ